MLHIPACVLLVQYSRYRLAHLVAENVPFWSKHFLMITEGDDSPIRWFLSYCIDTVTVMASALGSPRACRGSRGQDKLSMKLANRAQGKRSKLTTGHTKSTIEKNNTDRDEMEAGQ